MNEGEFSQLSCVVSKGDEPLKLSWSFYGHNLTSGQGITITEIGTRISMLVINSIGHRHMGIYTCKAENKAGSVTRSASLKVNGNYSLSARKGKRKGLGIVHGKLWSFLLQKCLDFEILCCRATRNTSFRLRKRSFR